MVGEEKARLKLQITEALDAYAGAVEDRARAENDPGWTASSRPGDSKRQLAEETRRARRLEADAQAVVLGLIDEALRA